MEAVNIYNSYKKLVFEGGEGGNHDDSLQRMWKQEIFLYLCIRYV